MTVAARMMRDGVAAVVGSATVRRHRHRGSERTVGLAMIVGICNITLAVPAARSLKDKRSALKPLIAHVRREFNVAIAEVDDQDRWQAAGLAVAAVGPEGANLHGVLEGVVRAIERTQPQVVVTDWQIEIL